MDMMRYAFNIVIFDMIRAITIRFRFFMCLFRFYLLTILCVFYVSLDHVVFVLLAVVVLGLVSSVLSQEIGWEERLQNDLYFVEWDVKP